MDHKYLSYEGLKRFFYTKILKQINLKIDKTNGDISNTKVRSLDTISTEFPDPVAGESTKTFLGKVKKCLADWKAIKSTLLTLSMLTNQYQNSTSTIPTSALVYALKQSTDELNSNLNDVKNVSYSVGSGIDANSCSGGIIYLLQKNSLCQIRGSITIVAALNSDSSRSIFSPEFNGQAYSPIPDGILLTYHVRYQDITGYLSYDATTKTFKLFNYSGKIISANSFIEIWGNYISNF